MASLAESAPWLNRLPPTITASFHLAQQWTRPIGLLVIEGTGSYEVMKTHYQEWARHLVVGGRLVLVPVDAESVATIGVVAEEMIRPGMWLTDDAKGSLLSVIRR